MNAQEIKQAIKDGKTIEWKPGYTVQLDKEDPAWFIIVCGFNGHKSGIKASEINGCKIIK